jgi:hypothetical protein
MRPETALMQPASGSSLKKLKDEGKVRQPPNAFILFSKEWHWKLASQYP